MWRRKQRLQRCICELRNAKDCWHHQKLAERPGTDLSSHPSEETGLTDILIWTFSLQNYKSMNFYYLKPPCLWHLIMADLGNYNNGFTKGQFLQHFPSIISKNWGNMPENGCWEMQIWEAHFSQDCTLKILLDHLVSFLSYLPSQKPL